jgi:hypothetical protein
MAKPYFAREDAIRRLHDTICMYYGLPYYVNMEGQIDQYKVNIYPLSYFYGPRSGREKPKTVDYTDEKFDYKQFPLGYGYSKTHGGLYFSRIPDRKQQQGLNYSTLRINGQVAQGPSTMLTEVMENCILGRYQPLEQAISLVKSGSTGTVPFHRRMAVSMIDRGLISLKYRLRSVGILDGKKSFKLLDNRDKEFLRNVISKEGVSVS